MVLTNYALSASRACRARCFNGVTDMDPGSWQLGCGLHCTLIPGLVSAHFHGISLLGDRYLSAAARCPPGALRIALAGLGVQYERYSLKTPPVVTLTMTTCWTYIRLGCTAIILPTVLYHAAPSRFVLELLECSAGYTSGTGCFHQPMCLFHVTTFLLFLFTFLSACMLLTVGGDCRGLAQCGSVIFCHSGAVT